MKKILILTANPINTDHLRLEKEVHEIEAALERAKLRDQFEVIKKWAVRPRDLTRAILDNCPEIIHFSGHGEGEPGIYLEDNQGQAKLVSTEALAGIFKLCTDHLECVILNACFSHEQAKEICRHIDYAIGMKAAVQDKVALEFAVGFYDALGAGRSHEDAYKFGCQGIQLEGLPQSDVPQFFSRADSQRQTVTLWVHGWEYQTYDGSPDMELDWTTYFSQAVTPRKIATPEAWESTLLPELQQARKSLTQNRSNLTIDVKG